jgi:hypothetical protein
MLLGAAAAVHSVGSARECTPGCQFRPVDLDDLTAAMEADVNPHRVIVDCSNSEEVADR